MFFEKEFGTQSSANVAVHHCETLKSEVLTLSFQFVKATLLFSLPNKNFASLALGKSDDDDVQVDEKP